MGTQNVLSPCSGIVFSFKKEQILIRCDMVEP